MTKKDYVLIGEVVSKHRVYMGDDLEQGIKNRAIFYLIRDLGEELAKKSKKFKFSEFIKVCGCQTHSELEKENL